MNIRQELQSNRRAARRRIVLLALASLVVFVIASMAAASSSSSPSHAESKSSSSTMPMPSVTYQEIPSGRTNVRRFTTLSNSNPKTTISIKSWMELVASNSPQGIQAATDLSDIISSSQYQSILFETMGTSWHASDTITFEFALVDQPALKRFAEGNPDGGAFDEHFKKCLERNENGREHAISTVCSFDNLGGDARLVSPLPQKSVIDSSYSHLAAFVRNAPKTQIQEFWAVGAQQYLYELEHRGGARWFSTNGMGVAWLHLRLDSRPKYYSYDPFTELP